MWLTYPLLLSNSPSVKWGSWSKAVDFKFIKQRNPFIKWNLMKNFNFYSRKAEPFWLNLGCREALGFLLVFQIIPWNIPLVRTSQEPSLKSTENVALYGHSSSDSVHTLATQSVVLGPAVAPGSLLWRQHFRSPTRPTESESTTPDSQGPQVWEALVCMVLWHRELRDTRTKGASCLSSSYEGQVSWGWKCGPHLFLVTPMLQCLSCSLDGEPAMGNSKACPWA